MLVARLQHHERGRERGLLPRVGAIRAGVARQRVLREEPHVVGGARQLGRDPTHHGLLASDGS
ncbi:hypothetical protein BC477_15370 [Clavibacter michiganensis subsp. michiganensis]|uniref:Uncharacterized protein n=1 Tax=Clavibacter michiganensis subsp. michiganensis TaxID=33013 RepID=A0A251XCA3_CLAMM|nr:hypothetical protein BC477_15370 [Clavibacter michiganensis subsp. michiganensis]OUD99779.1 hypothetical protein CMMCAS07_20105 [Clavibacter michiganensis subsp. michiganensis]